MRKFVFSFIGWLEVLIGVLTFTVLLVIQIYQPNGIPVKPLNVFVFVMASAVVSFVLGLGLVFHKDWASILLMFFSGFIMLEKLQIFSGLLAFKGEIITVIPVRVKDVISFIYHTAILASLWYFKCNSKEETDAF
ncbi:MAG: hypothetical protein WBD24_02030 [Candidatus Omnitrophota bacterium]